MKLTVPYTNTSEQIQNIGGRAIHPGETREVDARFVPASPLLNRQLKILFINFGTVPRYFGTDVVQPLQAMRLSVIHFENPNRPDAGKVQDDIFTQLLDRKIDDIKPYFSKLEDEELQRLVELESQDQARKSLIKDIETELDVRTAEQNFDASDYASSLEGKDESELQIELLSVGDNQQKIQAIQEALSALKTAEG